MPFGLCSRRCRRLSLSINRMALVTNGKSLIDVPSPLPRSH
jgi:hypothetical protein